MRGTREIETVEVDRFGNTPELQRKWDEQSEFDWLPSGLDAKGLARQLDVGESISPIELRELHARYVRAKGRKPGRARLDRGVEDELLSRVDELREWEKRYESAESWQERARLRSKRPEPYAKPGETPLEVAERRVHGYAYTREREAWAEGERRRLEAEATERQLARVRAEKIIEEEEQGGLSLVGAWAVKREAGLGDPNVGVDNPISGRRGDKTSGVAAQAARKVRDKLIRKADGE